MDRAVLAGVPGEPDLFHGEGQDRRQPGDQSVEEIGQNRPRGAPAQAVGRVAVERILADVEPEGREIERAEIEERPEDALEVIGFEADPHLLVELGEPVQDEPLQLRHLGSRHPLGLGKAVKARDEEAERVAQAPVAVGGALEDLGSDAEVGGIVRLRHPQPQDVGAVLADDLLRRGGVAEGLRHLLPGLVEREAMGQHGLVGRAATVPQAWSSEEWNQPRCWSVPSR